MSTARTIQRWVQQGGGGDRRHGPLQSPANKLTSAERQEILSIAIAPEVVDPDDVEMLEDMVLAAVNEALEKSRELAADRMSAFTGGLDIPGLM